jgi:hypothetical protein
LSDPTNQLQAESSEALSMLQAGPSTSAMPLLQDQSQLQQLQMDVLLPLVENELAAFEPSHHMKRRRRGVKAASNITLEEHEELVEYDPKRRLICHLCHKGFPKPYDLQRHIRSHTGEKPFHCEVEGCGKGFVQVRILY